MRRKQLIALSARKEDEEEETENRSYWCKQRGFILVGALSKRKITSPGITHFILT